MPPRAWANRKCRSRTRWARWRGCAWATRRRAAVDASLAALRERDAKAHLAYALNETAALALAADRPDAAAACAGEALADAQAVRRATVIAARRAARGVDTRPASRSQLCTLPAEGRSALAAAAIDAATRTISTLFPTGAVVCRYPLARRMTTCTASLSNAISRPRSPRPT